MIASGSGIAHAWRRRDILDRGSSRGVAVGTATSSIRSSDPFASSVHTAQILRVSERSGRQ
jgi:hypothetical protein